MHRTHNTFGADLRAARENAGVSQAAFARSTGLWQSQVSAFEQGTRAPSIAQLVGILDELGIPEKQRYRWFESAALLERALRAAA